MQKIIRIRRIQSSDRKELWGAVQNEKLLGKGSGNKEVILSQKKKKKKPRLVIAVTFFSVMAGVFQADRVLIRGDS